MLDCWIRDVIYSYQNMNESQQTMVKTFLGLDRDNSKCIFLHDKMFHGVVEAPRATYGIAARGSAMNDQPLTPPRTPRDSDLSEVPNTPSQSYLTPSAVNGAAPSETSTSSRPPLAKRSLTTPITASEMQSASNQHRKTAYRVKIVTSTSLLSRTPTISEGTNESSSSDGFNALPVSSGVSSAASHHQNKIEKLPQQQVKGPSKAGNQSQECCIIA